MKRRRFLQNIAYAGGAGLSLGGIPINLLAGNNDLKKAALSSTNENVLVFVQLHGGNDALNTLIPVSQYNEYYNLRPNIAIPDHGTRRFVNIDTSEEEIKQVGLHPDMLAIKEMYDQGKIAIVQNVGYPDMNLSHFRGRDIVFMGGDASSEYNSGWMGRFLDYSYPGYPDAYPDEDMPDPIGIELSGTLSLAFHRENGIPIGLNVGNPNQFYQLITSVGVDPPISIPDSYAGDELRYIMEFEKKSNQYAGRLKDVYDSGTNSPVVYPEAYPFAAPGSQNKNPLSGQLRLIARLIKGGIKTRIFLVRIGGFDTHGEQVETYDSTLGTHAALLYHLSSAMKAFYDDLKLLGMDQKVLSVTFTEFGRRAFSNASYGTDHGTSTPVMVFGTGLNPGLYGPNADLTDLHNGNLKYNIDYRQIYTSVVQDWFGADNQALINTGFNTWVNNKIPLIKGSATGDFQPLQNPRLQVYPNPFREEFSFYFELKQRENLTVTIFNQNGKIVKQFSWAGEFGNNELKIQLENSDPGIYHIRVQGAATKLEGKAVKL